MSFLRWLKQYVDSFWAPERNVSSRENKAFIKRNMGKRKPPCKKIPKFDKAESPSLPDLSNALLNPQMMSTWIDDIDEQLEVYYSELRNTDPMSERYNELLTLIQYSEEDRENAVDYLEANENL